jgi:DnaK suppressor protein
MRLQSRGVTVPVIPSLDLRWRSWSQAAERDPNRITAVDAERARERLAEERARIEQELAGLGTPEASDSPEDTGDQAADLEQAETDEGLRQDLQRTLEAIERAEARLTDGTYGTSVISGDPLPDERLEAIPWADRKVDE